jgi:hypothetical protein
MVIAMLSMIAIPAIITLRTVRQSATLDLSGQNASPHGYTVSLLLFCVPIATIGLWLIPQVRIKISKWALWLTIAILFPLGAGLDFLFANSFFRFPNSLATLGWHVPVRHGSVPVEEFAFYLTGFLAVLLTYIWLDEYWLSAYSIPSDASRRTNFDRLLRFHPESLIAAVLLILAAIVVRTIIQPGRPGFPGYFIFLVVTSLGPSALLFPAARPVINWRAFSMTLYIILLTSLLWEATLALPYGWWGYQQAQMIGIHILAWDGLPLEAVIVWLAVTFTTVITYEIIKRWKASGKPAKHAFLGVTPRAARN